MEVDRSHGPATSSWRAWQQHYRAASKRRRAAGGHGRTRAALRRRNLRELVKMGVSALAVAALTGLFYLLLSR
jgi:hypothetical protein